MNTRYIYALILFMAILCGGCSSAASPTPAANALRARPTPGGSSSSTTTTTTRSATEEIVLTRGLNDDGCAIDSVTSFDSTDAIYVVAEMPSVQAGTSFFARLYEAQTVLEDSEEVTADQAYNDVCVNFVFEPRAGMAWSEGNYEIEFFVNGNSYQFADFQIR